MLLWRESYRTSTRHLSAAANEMPPKGIKKKEAPIAKKESHVCATFLIGQSVTKTFKGIGTFKGRVTDFHRDTGFRVEYEDGDTEDLTEAELVRACTPPANHALMLPQPPPSPLAPCVP